MTHPDLDAMTQQITDEHTGIYHPGHPCRENRYGACADRFGERDPDIWMTTENVAAAQYPKGFDMPEKKPYDILIGNARRHAEQARRSADRAVRLAVIAGALAALAVVAVIVRIAAS